MKNIFISKNKGRATELIGIDLKVTFDSISLDLFLSFCKSFDTCVGYCKWAKCHKNEQGTWVNKAG